MGEQGCFRGQRVELIEGEVIPMSPQGPSHYGTVDTCEKVLTAAFGHEYWVRMQGPLDLGEVSEPEPDVAVVEGSVKSHLGRHAAHPRHAVLVIEVSDTTLAFDRGKKGSSYASCSLLDYWIANLRDGVLEVYRNPIPDPSQPHGFRYARKTVFRPGEVIQPLARPDLSIAASRLLEGAGV